jgi:hypothetical protein
MKDGINEVWAFLGVLLTVGACLVVIGVAMARCCP